MVKLVCDWLSPFAIAVVVCLSIVITTPAKWSRVESKTLVSLKSVFFIDEDRGWVVGSKGTFLTTNDGGRTWQQNRKFTDDNIRDIYFSDLDHGWLLCERDIYYSNSPPSYFLRTSDGGTSWETIELKDSRDRLVRLYFTRDGYGYAVGEGGAIWQMQDDKKSWKRVGLPIRNLILGVTFLDDFRGFLVGGGGTILFTTDGGAEWERATFSRSVTGKLNSVFFSDRDNGWIAGAGGKIFATNNGGKSWRGQVSGTNEDLTDVVFVTSNEGVAVGDKGTILETRTGGEAWAIAPTGLTSPLERVFFIGSAGYAVGFGGVILTNRFYETRPPSEK